MLSHDEFVLPAMLEIGLIDRAAVEKATRHAAENHVGKSEAAISLGLVTARDAACVRATICEVPFVDVGEFDVDVKNATMLPRSVAEGVVAFPLFALDAVTTVGMADPLDLKAVDRLRALLKTDIDPVLCEPESLKSLIRRAYSMSGGEDLADSRGPSAASLTTGEEPIVAAVNQILANAIDEGASDVHIGPDEQSLHLRYRIDGTLHARHGPPLAAHPGLVQRLKVMANLDLTVSRRPQDGKFRYTHGDKAVDVRLSVIPTVCGENVVMRLLATNAAIKDFSHLGFPVEARRQFEEVIEHPHGMVLVCGPTGSGKTTTLYAALKKLNKPDVNIMTIEDPVEIRLPLVRQVQVHAEIGMTFAGALRSILRQDPDVVLVGEIRDEDTARIAVQAALTGHLVFSTLHTNDAPGAVARLADFGCPPFAINAAVLCAMAQRLVRRVCEHCAAPAEPDPMLMARFGIKPGTPGLVRGSGCGRCSSTGFRGRIGVYELMMLSQPVQRAIDRGAPTHELAAVARSTGMRPMWQDGLDKARIGMTTLEEVATVVALEMSAGEPKNKMLRDEAGTGDMAA